MEPTPINPSSTTIQAFRFDHAAIKVEARRHGVRIPVLIGAMQSAWENLTHEQQREAIWKKQQWVFDEIKRLTEDACRNPTQTARCGPGCTCGAAG